MLFVACGSDDDNNDTAKVCNPVCNDWEECDNGACKLKDGKCNTDDNCADGLTCNTDTHECQAKETKECAFGTLSENGDCIANKDAIKYLDIATGTYPNDMHLKDNALYIVNSGDNAIQKIELNDMSNINPYASLPENSNPYFMTFDDDGSIFGTNLMTNTYSKITPEKLVETNSPEGEEALKGPEGIVVNSDYIFISNTNSSWDSETNKMVYDDGFVTVINKVDGNFYKKLIVSQKNPQRLFVKDDKLYVINSGTVEFDENYKAFPKTDGGIDVFDLNNLDSEPKNAVIPFQDGKLSGFPSPYTLSEDGNTIYLASGTTAELYSYDMTNSEMLRNTDNPIIIDDNTQTAMLNLTSVNKYLFVVNFNNDMLYIVDTTNDYKVILKTDIGEDSETLEGPQGIVYDKDKDYIYIYFGISKKIVSIDLNTL